LKILDIFRRSFKKTNNLNLRYTDAMYKITISKGKEKQLLKHHPWVFSGAIKSIEGSESGDWAEVKSEDDRFIAYGYYDEKSHVVLHLLSWDQDETVGDEFVARLVKEAVMRRKALFSANDTTAFRLIHGEADFIPGIAADCYGREIRIIISSRFASRFIDVIVKTLTAMLHPSLIQTTVDPFYGPSDGLADKVSYYINGEEAKEIDDKNVQFAESGIYYEVQHGKGQKSGFYCDQRDNRRLIEEYAKGKRVLDICSYTGGFTLHALKAGALSVDAVDSSESALRHLLFQVHLNEDKKVLPEGSRDKVTIKSADAFDYIREVEDDKYDLIILDPPKLARTKSKLENAQKAYKDLNRVAMRKIKNGGIIATFSCSGAMTRELFQLTLAWAAADAGVEVQILKTLSAGEDHPVRMSFPESEYLKGFIIRVIKH